MSDEVFVVVDLTRASNEVFAILCFEIGWIVGQNVQFVVQSGITCAGRLLKSIDKVIDK